MEVGSRPTWGEEMRPVERTEPAIVGVPYFVTTTRVRPYTRTHSNPEQSSQSIPFEGSGGSLVGLTTAYVDPTGGRRVGTNVRLGFPSTGTGTRPVVAKMVTPTDILKQTTDVRTYGRLHFASSVFFFCRPFLERRE